MDQRTIVACLALKGLSPRAIHKDLMDTPWPDAAAYSSVRHYFRDACCLPSVQRTRSVEVDRGINEANQAWHDIVTLDESWFSLSTEHEFVCCHKAKKLLNASDTQFNRKSSC
jgi:hypothetical protein